MGPVPFICTTCGKQFNRFSRLQMHARSHTNEKPYKCLQCDKAFRRKEDSKRHMIAHTRNNIPSISCTAEGCDRKFKLERRMKRHFESAHALYKCTFDGCELAFNKKRKLKTHLETHNDDKQQKCTYDGCTATFVCRRNLSRHLKNHEKMFKCTIIGCNVVVKSWSELRKHLKTHTKVHCKECDVVCPDEAAFKNHCKDSHHVPKSAVECPYEGCSRTYSRASNLNTHIRSYHKGRRFECSIEGCDREFRHRATLDLHVASHEAPVKKTKKKRKRKSLAAKLARYNGELCDLPVTYVEPNDDKALVSASAKTPSQECYYVSTDSLSRKGENEEEGSVGDTSVCPESVPSTLTEQLKMVIRDSHSHVNESCSTESNSDNDFSKEHPQVLECSVSS